LAVLRQLTFIMSEDEKMKTENSGVQDQAETVDRTEQESVGTEGQAKAAESRSTEITQEEADAIAKGLEGLESFPDIPDLEDGAAEPQAIEEDASSIDNLIASVKGTSGFSFESPSVTSETLQAKPVSFPRIDENASSQVPPVGNGVSMGLLMDIPVKISVVLGRTKMTIGEIISLEPGTVVELDRLVGEPVEILANGKLILHGEVVVIDENFGIRVTELVGKVDHTSLAK